MLPPMQEQRRKHPVPLWMRWTILLSVLLLAIGLAMLWIIQGAHAFIPIVVITIFGLLFGFLQLFFQLLPPSFLFADTKHEASITPPSQSMPISDPSALPSIIPLQTSQAVQAVPLDGIAAASFPASITRPLSQEATKDEHTTTTMPKGHESGRIDWGEAPYGGQFYGRGKELTQLKQWIVDDSCRVVALLSMGGMGKTSLAVNLIEQIKDEFDYVFWRSLQNAPPLKDFLEKCILFLSDQQHIDLPTNMDNSISLLITYLREKHCLLVLDNLEGILQGSQHAGRYMDGYEGYGKLIQRIGEAKHQSCLFLTSREKPQELVRLEGVTSPVRSLLLYGLGILEGRKILGDKGMLGSDEAWTDLIEFYSGNPLALKLVYEPVRELFGGNVSKFLKEGEVGRSMEDLLDQQFRRLLPLEQEIMYWLAIGREGVSLEDLREDIVSPVSRGDVLDALASLRRRSMIEAGSATNFSLQPVILEYVTNVLTKKMYEGVVTETIGLFGQYALLKAQAKEYVRESQVRLILMPVAQRLLISVGEKGLKQKCGRILSLLRDTQPQQSCYAAGNVLNLLSQLKCELRGYDFSHLSVWQAYLQGVALPDFNFAYAEIKKSAFTDTFGNILCVVFSPNGELVAAGTTNCDIRIWLHCADSVTPMLHFQGHEDWVRSVTFSPDGQILASGGNDQTIRLWDIRSGDVLHILQGHRGWVRSVTFSPDGQILASGGNDQTIRLWDTKSGNSLQILEGHTGEVRSVAFSPDGTKLASVSQDQSVRLWDINKRHCLTTFQGHTDEIWSVAFSTDGQLLASSGDDRTIRLWDLTTNTCLKVLQGHTQRVRSIAFRPNSKILTSSSEDETIRLWDTEAGTCLSTLRGHGGWVRSVAFSPDGNIVASGSDDQTVRLWDIGAGQCLTTLHGYNNWIKSVAFSPDGAILASTSEDKTVRLWSVSTGECFRSLCGHTKWIRWVAFNPDGSILASGSEDYTIRLWETSTGQNLSTLRGHSGWVTSVVFSPDGSILASGSEDSTIRLWNANTGQCLKIFHGHSYRVGSVAFSPDGSILASGSDDRTIQLTDLATGQCLKIFYDHSSRVRSVAFSPDGTMLASGSGDQTVRLWEVSTGRCLYVLHGHNSWIRSVAFSPDGNIVASGSDDRTIRLWEASTGLCQFILQGHSDHVRSISFGPNEHLLASASRDGTIKLWNIQTGQCLKTLKCNKPYERMNIIGVTGLTDVQKATLKALGAVED